MRFTLAIGLAFVLVTADLAAPLADARAELALSQLVVELTPGDHSRTDLEVLNTGSDQAFVSVDPREIIAPGTLKQSRQDEPDPEKLGLLVSPARIILDPGQRRLIRIAAIAPPSDSERVYRVTVKPVAGQLEGQGSGLKILLGYDVLVLVRPRDLRPHISGTRSGNEMTLQNDGNVSLELVDGQRCEQRSNACKPLPGTRLYAGASTRIPASPNESVVYKAKIGSKVLPVEF